MLCNFKFTFFFLNGHLVTHERLKPLLPGLLQTSLSSWWGQWLRNPSARPLYIVPFSVLVLRRGPRLDESSLSLAVTPALPPLPVPATMPRLEPVTWLGNEGADCVGCH